MKDIKRVILLFIALIHLVGCVSVARLSDFSKTSEDMDFDSLSNQNYEKDDAAWNQQTEFEYFVEVANINEDDLIKAIEQSLTKYRYKIVLSDKPKRAILAERGLEMNEWNSITGVYYRQHQGGFQVYFKTAITQDVTGGWRSNRAKKIALVFCSIVGTCNISKQPEEASDGS